MTNDDVAQAEARVGAGANAPVSAEGAVPVTGATPVGNEGQGAPVAGSADASSSAPAGVEIVDGRMGYDTRNIRTYDDSSSVGKGAYDHAKRRLERWQTGEAKVSGIVLDAATQARMLANIQACLKRQGYDGELLQRQSEMLLYKLVQSNLLYHPREKITVAGETRTATDVIGNHREVLQRLAREDMGSASNETLDQMSQGLMKIEEGISDRGHAILGVRSGQGRSFDTSKRSGFTSTEGNRQISTDEQAALDKALFDAVKRCDLDAINQAVRMGANLNAKDEEGRTPLDLVDEIIHDEELDDKELSEAELKAYENLRAGMIRAKALTNDDQDDLEEELLDLVEEGKIDEANSLIKSSRSLTYNAVANEDEMTYLMVALEEDNAEMALNIINSGVNVNAKDEDGLTALHYVARMDADDVSIGSRLDLMQKLIAQGANINAVDEQGRTVLDYVASLDDDEGKQELTALLQRHGAMEGRTALFTAIRNGDVKQVEALIREGVDIDVTEDGTGYGVLHFAATCTQNQAEMCKLLLELGADPEQESNDNATPLHVAAQTGNVAFAQALLAQADVNVNAETDEAELTPLHIAAGSGHNEMVDLLMRHGADTEAENKDDKKPRDLALENGNQMGVMLTTPAGAEPAKGTPPQQPAPGVAPGATLASGAAPVGRSLTGQNITNGEQPSPQNGILPPEQCF